MGDISAYRCNHPDCTHTPMEWTPEGLRCPNGHVVSFSPGTRIPVFSSQPEGLNEYTREGAASIHDNSLAWLFKTFRTSEKALRTSLVGRLALRSGDRVLLTGAGAGNDLPYIAGALQGQGEIFAQDFARQMLLVAAERHEEGRCVDGVPVHFSVSDATSLPFADDFFDAAYHFGGINLYSDVRSGIAEMDRVVRPGGGVMLGDEGIAPWLRGTETGKMLIQNNALYACEPPLDRLPPAASAVRLSWELGNCFYVLDYKVSGRPPEVDFDVPHVGRRGGTVRSRYYGRLEGVDPAVKDRIYAEAERRGWSRVDYLEALLRAGLDEG